MIEGTKIFTQYTNKWKGKELIAESKESMTKAASVTLDKMVKNVSKLPMQTTRGTLKGKQYKPQLPQPQRKTSKAKISFIRPVSEVNKISNYLFDMPQSNASKVGERCFEIMLGEASE